MEGRRKKERRWGWVGRERKRNFSAVGLIRQKYKEGWLKAEREKQRCTSVYGSHTCTHTHTPHTLVYGCSWPCRVIKEGLKLPWNGIWNPYCLWNVTCSSASWIYISLAESARCLAFFKQDESYICFSGYTSFESLEPLINYYYYYFKSINSIFLNWSKVSSTKVTL